MSKNMLKLYIFYIGTKDGELKHTYYTNPQPGGSFLMPTLLLEKYPFLVDFASTKPTAALLLLGLFCIKRKIHPLITSVSQVACLQEEEK